MTEGIVDVGESSVLQPGSGKGEEVRNPQALTNGTNARALEGPCPQVAGERFKANKVAVKVQQIPEVPGQGRFSMFWGDWGGGGRPKPTQTDGLGPFSCPDVKAESQEGGKSGRGPWNPGVVVATEKTGGGRHVGN